MKAETQKTCLITGAAGGIGRALVNRFAAANYKVIATDIQGKPGNIDCDHYLQIDLKRTVNDREYAEKQFAVLSELLAPTGLKALINNAAVQIVKNINDLTVEDWHATVDVNVLAPFFWTKKLLPQLEKANGAVVNVSSIHAHLTKRGFVAYATSKAALSAMTRAMAVELGKKVRVNAIEPAAIETDMLKAGFKDESAYKKLRDCHPQGRLGLPSEVANLAFTLVEGGFAFAHGGCYAIDGGIGARLHDPE